MRYLVCEGASSQEGDWKMGGGGRRILLAQPPGLSQWPNHTQYILPTPPATLHLWGLIFLHGECSVLCYPSACQTDIQSPQSITAGPPRTLNILHQALTRRSAC